ncbi:gamma-glutamylaminecyclotransferase [Elysia marginata]|uniref:Gamma-glutamylcyclotransferase family protein n=1 Tax=Elysia marginata TaxID=1093978 RepID=A0AAV4HD30_9GAST|nr:gamma-glutamylaminecyclotransferase [Elysia marginata]
MYVLLRNLYIDSCPHNSRSSAHTAMSGSSAGRYLIFVYGTLKTGQPNHYLFTDSTFSKGTATLLGTGETSEKYPLVVSSDNHLPFLLRADGRGENVEGEIYEIDGPKLDWLDEFESHPDFYRRELTDIRLKDGTVHFCDKGITAGGVCECWVYFLSEYKPEMLLLKMLKSYSSWSPDHLPYNERCEFFSTQ